MELERGAHKKIPLFLYLFHIGALILFVYSIPSSALITINVKTV
jgi:hypothetical protein